MENKKIPMWKKISYGCGAGSGNVVNTLLAAYLTGYYTDTVGIAAASVGTMYLISRIFDGFTDFAMGSIVDKTHTKWGKARPWLVLSAPLMLMIGAAHLFVMANANAPQQFYCKELTLRASYINPYTQKRALELIDSGRLDVQSMICETAGLEELEEILKTPALRAEGKYIISPEDKN